MSEGGRGGGGREGEQRGGGRAGREGKERERGKGERERGKGERERGKGERERERDRRERGERGGGSEDELKYYCPSTLYKTFETENPFTTISKQYLKDLVMDVHNSTDFL